MIFSTCCRQKFEVGDCANNSKYHQERNQRLIESNGLGTVGLSLFELVYRSMATTKIAACDTTTGIQWPFCWNLSVVPIVWCNKHLKCRLGSETLWKMLKVFLKVSRTLSHVLFGHAERMRKLSNSVLRGSSSLEFQGCFVSEKYGPWSLRGSLSLPKSEAAQR